MSIAKRFCQIVFPVVVLILLLLSCTNVASAAATTQEKEIAKIAQSNEKVITAICMVYQRTCVIALQTEKFTDKSGYDKFCAELENEIMQKYNLDKVIISRNPKIMHAISKIEKMSESEREEAIEKILERHENGNRPPMIQPR